MKLALLAHTGIIVSFLAIIASAADQTCYFPDKSVHAGGQSCNPNSTDGQPCCEKNQVCLSNQLCWDSSKNHVVRGSCTDVTWGSGCPHYCRGQRQADAVAHLRQCNHEDNVWVCKEDVTVCNNTFSVPPGYVRDYRAAGDSGVVAAHSTEDLDGGDGGGPSALATGLGAGLGVGVPLLGALLLALWFLRRAGRELASAKAALVSAEQKSQISSPAAFATTQAWSPPLPKDGPGELGPREAAEVGSGVVASLRKPSQECVADSYAPSQHRHTPSQTSQAYSSAQQPVDGTGMYQASAQSMQELEGEGYTHELAERHERFSYMGGETPLVRNNQVVIRSPDTVR
ncbi:hypothetical protein F5Y15DRAFT_307877 [Xylariaceae sp. FL0016]|nr:hypothetical protein F5Y15DRAFT_307877 [Xylariaceae sp. FL0016]